MVNCCCNKGGCTCNTVGHIESEQLSSYSLCNNPLGTVNELSYAVSYSITFSPFVQSNISFLFDSILSNSWGVSTIRSSAVFLFGRARSKKGI